MSKVSNSIRMILLLKSRGRMKVSQLAKHLEVEDRQIMRYKEEIEKAGIIINSTSGRYGGYELQNRDHLFKFSITKSEENNLLQIKNYLKKNNTRGYEEFAKIVDKLSVFGIDGRKSSELELFYASKEIEMNYDSELEEKIWLDFNAAMIMKQKIEIEYLSLKKEKIKRIVRPYGIFQYEGGLYMVGFCELRNEIRQFKLSRIESYIFVDEFFEMDEDFELDKYINEGMGIVRDGKLRLKLKIYEPLAQVVREKIWVKNQKITEIENSNYIIFEAEMKGIAEVKMWVLGMGTRAEVMEPISFRNEIEEELKSTLEIYKK